MVLGLHFFLPNLGVPSNANPFNLRAFFLSTQALCLFGVFEPVLSGHMRGVAG